MGLGFVLLSCNCRNYGRCNWRRRTVRNPAQPKQTNGRKHAAIIALPNGYQIMMIDVTDQVWVYKPKTQPTNSVLEREDSISGVRKYRLKASTYWSAATARVSSIWDRTPMPSTAISFWILKRVRKPRSRAMTHFAAVPKRRILTSV